MATYESFESAVSPPQAAPGLRVWPVDWGAVFAGAIAALVAQLLINLLAVGVGAVIVDPGISAGEAKGAGAAAFVWWSIAGIISALIGGMFAGGLAAQSGHRNVMTHGFLTWALGTLVVLAAVAGLVGQGSSVAGGPLAAQLADYGALSGGGAGAPGAAAGPGSASVSPAQLEAAADAVAGGALASFVALVVGAAAAVLGARWAGKRTLRAREETRA